MAGLPELHAAQKMISGAVSWVEDDRGKLHIFAPLEIGGITRQGFFLRARASKELPDQELMFQLESEQSNRRDFALDRIDWRPIHQHNNRGKGPPEWRYKWLTGSHRHSFDLNWFPEESRMLRDNLPIALPIPDEPKTFQEVLVFIKNAFRINNVDIIPIPPWEGVLL